MSLYSTNGLDALNRLIALLNLDDRDGITDIGVEFSCGKEPAFTVRYLATQNDVEVILKESARTKDTEQKAGFR